MRRPLRAQPRRQVWPPFTIAAIVGLTACNAALGSASVLRDWAVRVGTGPAARAKPHLRAAVSLGSEQSTALQRRPLDLPAAKQSFIQWWYAAHVGVVPMHGVGGLDGDLTMSRIQLPATRPQCPPWNKGRLIGQKRPLLPRQVWAIRARLKLADNLRDLALFNLAIDSKLRGCDLVRLKVVDLVAGGCVRARASSSRTRPGGQFNSKYPRTRGDLYSRGLHRVPCLVRYFCSQASSTAHHTSQRASMRASLMTGCLLPEWIQAGMARIL